MKHTIGKSEKSWPRRATASLSSYYYLVFSKTGCVSVLNDTSIQPCLNQKPFFMQREHEVEQRDRVRKKGKSK